MIKFFPNTQTFVQIGPVSIAWYAILIMTGAFLAYYISQRNLLKVGYKRDDIEDLFMGSLIAGFLGARIWYVLFFEFKTYLAQPLRIFAIHEGGLAIQGGLIAGVAFGYWFTKRRRLNFIQWADLIIPNILLAQAIGRWGNFMNKEAYGRVVQESFYNHFPMWFKDMMFIDGAFRQPTFFYESVANIIGWILIVFVLKRLSKIKRGDLTFAYMMWYGATRFIIEGFRSDSLMFGPIRVAQFISIIFVVVGVAGYLGCFKKYLERPKPIILFDFDGTIANTQACILETFRRVFEIYKPEYQLDEQEMKTFLGPTLHDTFSKYFEEDEIDSIIQEYRRINHELHDTYVVPMEHAIEILEDLKNEGYRMGIVSNKITSTLELGMEVTGIKPELFEVVLGCDLFEPVKPDPAGIDKALELMNADRGQLIYVGDTTSDILAGQRAGSFTIGYVFDKIREKDLEESKPNRMISDLMEIKEILKEDHEWTITMM